MPLIPELGLHAYSQEVTTSGPPSLEGNTGNWIHLAWGVGLCDETGVATSSEKIRINTFGYVTKGVKVKRSEIQMMKERNQIPHITS